MTGAVSDLGALGAAVEWPDAEASATARGAVDPATGRLGELVEWLAGAQHTFPPVGPSRARLLVLGPVADHVAALAASLDVGVRGLPLTDLGTDPATWTDLGASVADDEIDAGTDLLVVAGGPASGSGGSAGSAAAVLISLITGAEPVALLPRGAGAVDTAAWIERAVAVRDTRHAVVDLRHDPDGLLSALDDAALAVTTALVLRAVARRTPVVLDGATAAVAAVLATDVQARAGRWWKVADTGPDPVHTRAVTELDQQPLLDLAGATGDGTAGLLTIPLLRAAALGVAAPAADPSAAPDETDPTA